MGGRIHRAPPLQSTCPLIGVPDRDISLNFGTERPMLCSDMLPFFAMLLPVLLLFCGLAIDVNVLQTSQTLDQLATDAAAGSSALEFQSGTGNWVSVGKQTSALYGVTDGSGGSVVTVVQRPVNGAYAGRDDAIQVTATEPSPTYFMRFVQNVEVSASAVALLPPCIVLRGAQAMTTYASTLQTTCPVYASGAISLSGSTSWSSAGVLLTSAGSINTGLPVSIANAVHNAGDPLASTSQPTAGSCRANAFTQTGGSVALQPGTYCNGMTLKNATVTLQPGLYVITGGAHWTGVTLQGENVTLFFTNGSSGFGQFVIDGSSTVILTAPVDSSRFGVPGVVIFGDRRWQAQSSTDFQISNARVQTDGIWYTTGTGIGVMNGTLLGPTYLGLNVDSLTLSSATIQGGADLSSITTGNPFQSLGGLAE